MKIRITIVGQQHAEPINWPEGWPVPSEGQEVTLGNGAIVSVRTVVWYPMGEEPDDDPFVYVVLGEGRWKDAS